jgi:AraC-like DNA-binding protein
MKFIGNSNEYLHLKTIDWRNCEILKETIESSFTILWFILGPNELIIDGEKQIFKQNQIVFLTEFHKVKIKYIKNVRLLRFNRSFYCILKHDAEVGCKGVLFFGIAKLPAILIPNEELEKFEMLWNIFISEMQSNDNLQIDMLQMMLKRYLILCTRIYKLQFRYQKVKIESDIINKFSFLVEQHFKTKHSVAEYAQLLNKSPKTVYNIFSKKGAKNPLRYIQERKMHEARWLLQNSSMQIKEVAYEIGYDNIQAFSRFFKKQEGISPSKFKEKI